MLYLLLFGAIFSILIVHLSIKFLPKSLCNINESSEVKSESQLSDEYEFLVHSELNTEITNYLETLLNVGLLSWYNDISKSTGFITEVRHCLKKTVINLYKIVHNLNIHSMIVNRIIPLIFNHLSLKEDQISAQIHLGQYFSKEEYLLSVVSRIVDLLIPPDLSYSLAAIHFVRELILNYVFLPIFKTIIDPNFINYSLLLLFDDSTSVYSTEPYNFVIFLNDFNIHFERKPSLLVTPTYKLTFREMFRTSGYLKIFINVLKREKFLKGGQLCLMIEDFNRQLLNTPEDQRLNDIFQKINNYFKSFMIDTSSDRMVFPNQLTADTFSFLCTTTFSKAQINVPLFKCYDFAVKILEKDYFPLFYQSPKLFHNIIGSRSVMAIDKFDYYKDNSSIVIRSSHDSVAQSTLINCNKQEYLENISEVDKNLELDNFINVDKDLSTWSLVIINLRVAWKNRNRVFRFIIQVTAPLCQTASVSSRSNSSQMWEVSREYGEFYALEQRLKIFHENRMPAELPPKRSLFKKDYIYLNSCKEPFQNFLVNLIKNPLTRQSSLLYTFLTHKDTFKSVGLGVEAGQTILSMKSILHVEKGQNLDSFILLLQTIIDKNILPTKTEPVSFISDSSHYAPNTFNNKYSSNPDYDYNLLNANHLKNSSKQLFLNIFTNQSWVNYSFFIMKVLNQLSFINGFMKTVLNCCKFLINPIIDYVLWTVINQSLVKMDNQRFIAKMISIQRAKLEQTTEDEIISKQMADSTISKFMNDLSHGFIDKDKVYDSITNLTNRFQNIEWNEKLGLKIIDEIIVSFMPDLLTNPT